MNTDSIKELVQRLRDAGLAYGMGTLPLSAADALEAMAGEVERLTKARNECERQFQLKVEEVGAVSAERDRLKAVLKPRLNAKAIEGLQEILEAMEAMDEREAPFLKTLLDWHEASRKALGDAS